MKKNNCPGPLVRLGQGAVEEEEEVAPSVTGQLVARWDEREIDDGYGGSRQQDQCTAQSQRLWSGKKEVEVVGVVGEAFSLSLRLGSPTICRAKAHTDNHSYMYIYKVPWTRLRVLHVLQLQLIQKSIHTTSQFATRILSGPALRHIRQVKMVAKIQTGQQKSKIR